MKPKMKYSTNKISTTKQKNTASKALCFKLGKSQQKAKEVCHVYFMKLRSGLTIKKEACYFRRETTKRPSLKTGRKYKGHLVLAACQQQSTVECFAFGISGVPKYTRALHDSSITDKVLLSYYESQHPSSESGDGVDGKMLMVTLSPTKDFWLQANNKEHSVELHKCEKPLPDQAFFVLHNKPFNCVSFECKTDPGVFIGVKDNHLALIKVDSSENLYSENILFKLSEI
ncbi:interleukin-33 isoform X2 [Rhinopithecus roxellana]|uniref:Interleukin-33 n=1 Tax=Rhinopithecus bieti TaxID=61621 RepID=A0AAJ7HQ21_RHIBE|nr:PREDICTED: interleukin-33 isoform X1 [Rhinopithecus bieti]XP_017732939.1 PREDICTED: interleukin-33 isoform X1 [Rhinopithecus bieti]XP_017732940.1 PREDICTED: interleukin-33 isoform X1 [Rhinopithecus bieti]XP_030776247.1 interleukin-33 isoform X2 [Rhinopithecus roxellana]